MWVSKRKMAERAADLESERAGREHAEQVAETLSEELNKANSEMAEMKKKYEPPVTVRRVIPTATETNRRRH